MFTKEIPAQEFVSQYMPQVAHAQSRLDHFYAELEKQYIILFAHDPEYAYAASITTPDQLARKMTLGLDCGSASKDGMGIRNVCRILGINHTYKAIRAYLSGY